MKKLTFLFIIPLVLFSCGAKKTDSDTIEKVEMPNTVTLNDAQCKSAAIVLGKSEKREIFTTLKLNGEIDVPPQNMVSVSMPLGGFLKSTQLLPGMHVKKGEVIATMEDQQYIQLQQEYLTFKSKLTYAEKEYLRQKELNQSKASSDKAVQLTEAEYTTLKITVSALAEKLRLININPSILNESNLSRSVNIYSSINGFVSKVNVNIGKYVNPSDILFELINPEDIHLNLKVFEKDLEKLSIGQKLFTYNNNQPEKKYRCEIILISQDLSMDRSADVHCHFEDYNKTLLPGMYMNADVEVKANTAATINDEAIVSYEGKDFVFVSREQNKFELLEIKKGSSENNYTEIATLDGSTISNFKIVTHGAYSLLMQLKNKSDD